MATYHVGCGLAGIYAGTWKKPEPDADGFSEWKNKSLVTEEAIKAVMIHLMPEDDKEVREVLSPPLRSDPKRRLRLTVEWVEE